LSIACQYLNKQSCSAITSSEEVKEAREQNCVNDNQQACCYLCESYDNCEISCNFLGENTNKTKKPKTRKQIQIIKCPLCETKMLCTEAKLRIGGWSGIMQFLPFGNLGELDEEVLPVKLYVCPKCGKLELMAQEKTIQTIISRT
jgi:hypothetical protein